MREEQRTSHSSVRVISQSKREIEVEIPREKVEEEFKKIVRQYAARAKIHGFRPGKAPPELVKQMFFPEIKKTFIDSVVPDVLKEELKMHNLIPVNLPAIQDLKFRENEPLKFQAAFEVWPEFKLPEYRRVEVKKREPVVTDEEIKNSLHKLQQNSAEYTPVKGRGVVEGDYVVAEVKGKDAKTKRYLPTEKVVILAGHADNEKKLNESILGLKEGEECKFSVSYGKEDENKKLAGRIIEYTIKIESIKEKNIPPINDDFARGLGEYENLDDLKEKIKEEILASKEKTARNEIAEEIIDKISEKISLELPQSLVERENMSILRRHLEQVPRQDLTQEIIEKLKKETRKQAEKNLRNHIILKKIAEAESIQVTEEDEDEEMKSIAEANRVSVAKVVDDINRQGRREELRESILMKKTVDFLVKQAIII
ncbi:MAG: trigger factor [Candidatus Aminicenantales bacterium]